MTGLPKHIQLSGLPAEWVDLLPVYEVMPWENAEEYEALQAALISDLNPKTAHELSIALRIAALDWEYYRSASLLRDVFSACVRKAACQMLAESGMGLGNLGPTPTDFSTARALVGEEAKARAQALATLDEKGISMADIRARAFLEHVHELEALERRPERNEARRRKLLQDLVELQAARDRSTVEEAEVILGHDH